MRDGAYTVRLVHPWIELVQNQPHAKRLQGAKYDVDPGRREPSGQSHERDDRALAWSPPGRASHFLRTGVRSDERHACGTYDVQRDDREVARDAHEEQDLCGQRKRATPKRP